MGVLKKYFDKIYCINYIECGQRRNNIINSAKELNILDDIEFYYSMPLHKINAIKNEIDKLVIHEPNYLNSNLGVSCALAHYSCIKSAYELGYDSVMIIEDDIIFRNDINFILSYFNDLPSNWEFINLDACMHFNYCNQYKDDLLYILNSKDKWIDIKILNYGSSYANFITNKVNWMSSGCYAMKRNVMKLYIDIFEQQAHIMNSDILQYFFHDTKNAPFNYYISNKRLVAQQQELNKLEKVGEQIKINFNYSGMIPTDPDIDNTNFIIGEKIDSIITPT